MIYKTKITSIILFYQKRKISNFSLFTFRTECYLNWLISDFLNGTNLIKRHTLPSSKKLYIGFFLTRASSSTFRNLKNLEVDGCPS